MMKGGIEGMKRIGRVEQEEGRPKKEEGGVMSQREGGWGVGQRGRERRDDWLRSDGFWTGVWIDFTFYTKDK